MDFSEAVVAMQEGKRVARPSWNPAPADPAAPVDSATPPPNPLLWLEIKPANAAATPPLQYVVLKTIYNTYVLWQGTPGDIIADMLAADWAVLDTEVEQEAVRQEIALDTAREREKVPAHGDGPKGKDDEQTVKDEKAAEAREQARQKAVQEAQRQAAIQHAAAQHPAARR